MRATHQASITPISLIKKVKKIVRYCDLSQEMRQIRTQTWTRNLIRTWNRTLIRSLTQTLIRSWTWTLIWTQTQTSPLNSDLDFYSDSDLDCHSDADSNSHSDLEFWLWLRLLFGLGPRLSFGLGLELSYGLGLGLKSGYPFLRSWLATEKKTQQQPFSTALENLSEERDFVWQLTPAGERGRGVTKTLTFGLRKSYITVVGARGEDGFNLASTRQQHLRITRKTEEMKERNKEK